MSAQQPHGATPSKKARHAREADAPDTEPTDILPTSPTREPEAPASETPIFDELLQFYPGVADTLTQSARRRDAQLPPVADGVLVREQHRVAMSVTDPANLIPIATVV